MSSQTSRKIIVASVMAVVVGIGVVIFALRSHPVMSVAQAAHPPTPVTQIPAAALREAETPAVPPPVAQIPDVPAAVTQLPDAPAAVAHHDSAGTSSTDTARPSAGERKLPRKQHLAKADTSAVGTNGGTVAHTGSAANTTETVTNIAEHAKSADELTTTPATSSPPAEDQKVGTSTEFVDSDSPATPK
jgi:hypothetical protein